MKPFAPVVAGLFALVGVVAPLSAQLQLPPDRPIRIGRTPALSPDGERLAFSWQGNLWTAPVKGGAATRLTANDSFDINPKWSPDGKWIAFNSDREGGNQVFLIPSVGGPARQVTHHSSPTVLADWFPDGEALLVTSARETRRAGIYRLDAVTGRMKPLVQDDVNCASPVVSPDGKWLAFSRGALVDTIRKGYRGSANFDIYIAPADGASPARRLTDSDCNDQWPAWSGDSKTVYFTSERAGIAGVWRQPREGGKPEAVVPEPPDAARFLAASRDGGTLAYEADNRIFTVPARGGSAREVSLLCRSDERGPNSAYNTYNSAGASEFALSADGKRIAFVQRGDVFTISTDRGGDAKRLTDNPTRDRDVAWSPDGKFVAYSSNREGGYRLYRADAATAETTPLTRGAGTDTDPAYSPDGKWLAFRRGPQTALYVVKPDGSGEQLAVKGPKIGDFRWSPDGKWLAFEREDDIRTDDIWIASVVAEGEALKFGDAVNVSDHPGFNRLPRWFADGSRIAFVSNRNRNRDIETINDQGSFALHTTTLEREKEKFEDEEPAPKPAMPTPAKPVEVKVDAREIERRAKTLATPDEGVFSYAVSPDSRTIVYSAFQASRVDLWQTTVDGSGSQRLTTTGEAGQGLQWAPDSSRFYYLSGGAIRSMPRGGGAAGTVAYTVRMESNRLVDYRAVFDEAWLSINDNYYDKTFHGVDWKAVGARYRALVEHVSTRQDLNYLVAQMLGELNSSHTGFSGGANPRPARPTGILGVTVDANDPGPGLKVLQVTPRGPADRDESRLKPGDFIVAIDGQDVRADASYDRALADKVGRTVTLLVNEQPSRTGARTVKIKPITRAALAPLLYEHWIDGRRAAVETASGGRLGYLHVSDMGDTARNRFERDLFSIGMRKDGMVLDLRDNNGGDTHDSLLRMLARNRHYFNFAPRTETPFPQPERAFTRPIILLINSGSLSDAEVFANGFRELGLGKIVGAPTMGWIIFTNSRTLVDGSTIRTPHLGCFTLNGRDMENWGVPPDIQIENTPADIAANRDPQLERAVKELLADPRLKR